MAGKSRLLQDRNEEVSELKVRIFDSLNVEKSRAVGAGKSVVTFTSFF